jgi:hypothetical protein
MSTTTTGPKKRQSSDMDDEDHRAAKEAKRRRGVNKRRQERASNLHALQWGDSPTPTPRECRVLKSMISSMVGDPGRAYQEYLMNQFEAHSAGMHPAFKDGIIMCLQASRPKCAAIMLNLGKHKHVLADLSEPSGTSEAHEVTQIAIHRFNHRSRRVTRIMQGLMCMFGPQHSRACRGVKSFTNPIVKARGTRFVVEATLTGGDKQVFAYVPPDEAIREWRPVALRGAGMRLELGSPLDIEQLPEVERMVAATKACGVSLGEGIASTVSEYIV